jgi:hypothetical protein
VLRLNVQTCSAFFGEGVGDVAIAIRELIEKDEQDRLIQQQQQQEQQQQQQQELQQQQEQLATDAATAQQQ